MLSIIAEIVELDENALQGLWRKKGYSTQESYEVLYNRVNRLQQKEASMFNSTWDIGDNMEIN